jgi:hypothetical protein
LDVFAAEPLPVSKPPENSAKRLADAIHRLAGRRGVVRVCRDRRAAARGLAGRKVSCRPGVEPEAAEVPRERMGGIAPADGDG